MKSKKKIFWIALLAVIIAIVIIGITAIIMVNTEDKMRVSVYYKEPILNTLSEYKVKITAEDDAGIIDEIFRLLPQSPKNSDLVTAFGEDVGILGYAYDPASKSITVNLSPSYLTLSDSDALFTRLSVIRTLTALDFVEDVYIEINGEKLLNSKGVPFGAFNVYNTVINQSIQPYNTEKKTVVLYFPEKGGLGLISENRNIEVKQNISLEYQIVEQLIAGPENEECTALIPKDTKIRNIETKEGTCYIDLSSDFSASGNDASKGTLIIYSIVNSLTELNYINKVQFLTEGKKADILGEISDFSKAYERNEKIIVAEETEDIEIESKLETTSLAEETTEGNFSGEDHNAETQRRS